MNESHEERGHMGVNIVINGLFEVNTAKSMNEFILGKSHMHAKVVIKASRQKLKRH